MIQLNTFQNLHFCRGASRLKELLWWVMRSLFFASLFPIPSSIKVIILRLLGAKMGNGVVIRSRVNITFPWRFECGDSVWIGDEVMILSLDHVRLGSNVCLSQRAFLCTGSHDYTRSSFDLITKPIEIGDGCWLGAQVFVGPGVVFESGSFAAAGAVVVKNVLSSQMVGGNPARPLSPKSA